MLRGNRNIFIGELQTGPEPVLKEVFGFSFRKIILRTLMMVSGHHWKKNVAGEGKGSLKNVMKDAGFEVICEKGGLLEREAVIDLFMQKKDLP